MAHVFVLAGLADSLVNFRGQLITDMIAAGHSVTAAASGPAPAIENQLNAKGVEYLALPLERAGTDPLADLRFYRAVQRCLLKVRPTDLLAYTVKPIIYGVLAAKSIGVERVHALVTGLGYAFMEPNNLRQRAIGWIVPHLYRFALAKCDTVLFQNPDDQALFRERGLLARGVSSHVVNGSGVDLDFFTFLPIPIAPPVFSLVARLLQDKGIGEFVEAARLLKSKYPTARFHLIGPLDPNPSAISQEQIDKWHQEGVIEYFGSTTDVRPYLAATTVYVLPSYREGTPRSVLEAMSMGRPVVTTDVPGCRETVRHQHNGFLVPARNPTALAAAMEKFLQSSDLAAVMGRRSRAIAEEKYDVHKVNAGIMRNMGLSNETVA